MKGKPEKGTKSPIQQSLYVIVDAETLILGKCLGRVKGTGKNVRLHVLINIPMS